MNWINQTIKTVVEHSAAIKKQRQFGMVILVFLLLVLGVSVFKEGWTYSLKQWFTSIGVIIIFGVLFLFPVVLKPLLFVWLFIGNVLGEISSFIILGFVYYFLLCPVIFVQKMISRKKPKSGWINKKGTIDYEKLY